VAKGNISETASFAQKQIASCVRGTERRSGLEDVTRLKTGICFVEQQTPVFDRSIVAHVRSAPRKFAPSGRVLAPE
jgi:hypothetical protein